MRPSTGISARTGISRRRNVLGGGTPTMLRPRNAESPAPKIVSARPETTWFARSPTQRSAWMAAIAVPAASAAPDPNQALPDQIQPAAPERAPINMIPSMPRLSTPARSVINSPRQANRMAVPAATAAARTETRKAGVRISLMMSRKSGVGSREPVEKISPSHPGDPITGEDFAAEEEEEDRALEHGGDCCRQAKSHLDLVSPDRERG